MPKKKLYNRGGIVYSTANNFEESFSEENVPSLPENTQLLKIFLDKKQRAGKVVTMVSGFVMREQEIDVLAKKLKTFCGSGGAVKNNEIIIQGDHRDKILQWLLKNGFTKSRKI